MRFALALLAIFYFTASPFAQQSQGEFKNHPSPITYRPSSIARSLNDSAAPGEPRFDRVMIDALDPDAWGGIVFLAKAYQQQVSFALQVGSRGGDYQDGQKVFGAVSEVGAHAPDASYCRLSWKHPGHEAPVTLEWSRLNETTVVGRVAWGPGLQVGLETYFPNFAGGASGTYEVDGSRRAILGAAYFNHVFGHVARLVVMTDQPLMGSGAFRSLPELQARIARARPLVAPTANEFPMGAAAMEFADGAPLHFVATIGWEKESLMKQAGALLAPGKIDAILKEKADAYAVRRPTVNGLFAGAPEAIGNSMFWTSLYAPQLDLIFPSISRHWAHDWGGWVVGEWDCFFDSLLTSLEDETQTSAGIHAILSAQTDTGLVPNIAAANGITPDRSEPPVGAYVVWKIYERRQDLDLLAWAYPRLKKYHEWWRGDRGDGQPWRDGNRDGLLELGSDRGSTASVGGRGTLQDAKYESGMDDSPMYDDAAYDAHTYTMNLADVGLNSLYTLDAECLAKIAAILGKEEDSRKFSAENERLKQFVRDKLWNDKDGIYENRFWDGRFSARLSPTNFYPMLAGIATPQQAERMVKEHLLNPKEFWGKYVTPTIARNDLAFPDQFYWRGDIWGPTNYLLYEGLDRYRFDQVAREYAQKNYDLFMDDWRTNQHDDEEYYAWGGGTGNDSSTHYTWGALLCLIPLEQYIDVNPWEGLRFGALNPPGQGEFRRSVWENHTYDVTVGPAKTALARGGRARFEANAGVVVRNYQTSSSQLTFSIKAERPVNVTTREFDSGDFDLKIDGAPAGRQHVKTVVTTISYVNKEGAAGDFPGKMQVPEGSLSFQVPAGEHAVELTK